MDSVQQHEAALRKELSLTDLVFAQALNIIGLAWIGTAAKLGSSHLVFWLAAIVLFYLPSAAVVVHLNREMPLEGGLYQWAKLRFNEATGFLVAWNMWIFTIVLTSETGLIVASNIAYAMGPAGAWIAGSKAFITGSAVAVIVLLVVVARLGLSIGKWIQSFSGFLLLALFVAMAAFAIPAWIRVGAAHPPLTLTMPAISLFSLNILGKMGFGALGGFDTVAIFAGECRGDDSGRLIRRSIWIATPIIAGAFVAGTACVLVFSRPDDIDLIAPITQVLQRGMQTMGIAGPVLATAVTVIVSARLGQLVLVFNAASRLPMVAGWDELLPQWFTRLHPKYRTPVGSIYFIGAATLVFAVAANAGVGSQEAYQLLQNASGILYCLPYLVMFAIPLVSREERAAWWLRAASVSGFLMTLLYAVLSVFPIIAVRNRSSFTWKVSAVVIGLNLTGALFYRRAEKRRASGRSLLTAEVFLENGGENQQHR